MNDDSKDEKPLSTTRLVQEYRLQQLEPLLSRIVRMAEANGGYKIRLDEFYELVREGMTAGVNRDEVEKHIRTFMQEKQIQLQMHDPAAPLILPPKVPLETNSNSNKEDDWSLNVPRTVLKVNPQPAADGQATPVAEPARWCPVCSQAAPAQNQFCGKCGLPLCCPRCRRTYEIGNRFCTSCGLDPTKFRQFQEQMDSGWHLLALSRGQDATEECLHQAERAESIFFNALAAFPKDQQGQALLVEAKKQITSLCWKLSEAACGAGRFSDALVHFERLTREASERSKATDRIKWILERRNNQLAEGKTHAAKGKWQDAVQTLALLAHDFPKDAEINDVLSEFRRKDLLVQKAAKDLPKLRDSRRMVELARILAELENNQVNLGWLAGTIEICNKRLETADEGAAAAEQLLKTGRYKEASAEVEEVLK